MRTALLQNPEALYISVPGDAGHLDRNRLHALIKDPTAIKGFAMKSASGEYLPKEQIVERLEALQSNGVFEVTFVRHPLTFWASFWRYRILQGWDPNNSVDIQCYSDNFNEFIEKVITHQRGWCSRLFELFTGPEDNQIAFIGRQENLANDFLSALTLSGNASLYPPSIVTDLPAINVTRGSMETKLDPVLRDALCAAEEQAIRRFYPHAQLTF